MFPAGPKRITICLETKIDLWCFKTLPITSRKILCIMIASSICQTSWQFGGGGGRLILRDRSIWDPKKAGYVRCDGGIVG